MITLEPDQQRLVAGVRASMAAGHKWTLMQSATGSGKTYMGSKIIQGAREKGKTCMLIVPRKELLRQSAEALREFEIPFSYIAAKHDANPFAKTFLASMQTLRRLVDSGKAPKVDLVLPDETHYGGKSLDGIIAHYKAAGAWGIGMSATPWFMNGRGMDCWYDDMVQGESIAWLIAAGRLSDYRLFEPSRVDTSAIKRDKQGVFVKESITNFMTANSRRLVGDAVGHYKRHAMGKLAIAYCINVRESELTAQRFNEAGIPAASIDGRKSDDERRRIIRAFARREILVLVNCDLLTFGFDLKSASGMDVTIEAMIDLAPTESLALQMQKWGRVLRRKPFPALIFDHAGNRSEHGYPDDDRTWKLQGSEKDKKGFNGGGTPVKNCNGGFGTPEMDGDRMPACYYSHRPAPRCPNCGAYYELNQASIKTTAGELVEGARPTPRPEMTMEDRLRIQEAIDEMTKNGINRGMPPTAARQWATKKASEQWLERAEKRAERALSEPA